MIRKALSSELPLLASIEKAAAEMFRGTPMDFVLSFPENPAQNTTIPDSVRIWVACDSADQPIGFLKAEVVEGWLHILELSVHPGHHRKGHARALIDAAREHARTAGLEAVSLTTDRDLPWNGPAYARMGFLELPGSKAPAWLQDMLADEIAFGFDALRRIAMVRHP